MLLDPQQRLARMAEKRRALLHWLRSEIFTDIHLAADIMGVETLPAVRKTLASMIREGLVVKHIVLLDSGRQVSLVGITPHGQALAFDPARETPEPRYFEPSRVPVSILAHALDLQRLRLAAERAGWTGWRYPDREGKWLAGLGRPDAIATTLGGELISVECERSVKTMKRYEVILADRLQAIKAGKFSRVIYTSPTRDLADRLAAIIGSIESVPIAGTRVRLEERHRAALVFASYDDFLDAASRAPDRAAA